MGKKKIVGLMGVAIVVLAVVGINSKRELAEARAALEQLEAEPATGDRQTEELLAQSPEAQTEPAETVASIAPTAETPTEEPPSADSEDPEPAGRRLMRSLSRMMDNPAMNKMMVASQRAALDVMYADLADQFQLNGDEREHFMELLLTRQMNMMDVSMKMMTGNLSKEEQDALSAELKEKNDLLKEEMEYFLNSAADVAEWEFYEKTLQDRMMLSQVEQALGNSDAAFSDQTYRQLLEVMNEERSSFDFSADFSDNQNMDMSAERFSPENIKSFADDLKLLNEKIADRAGEILTPEQLDAFMKSLTANMEMQLAQLEMAGQMFGKK